MGASEVPDLDRAIFASCHQPLALAVERNGGDVAVMPLERNERPGRGAGDFVDIDLLMNRGGQQAFTETYIAVRFLLLNNGLTPGISPGDSLVLARLSA